MKRFVLLGVLLTLALVFLFPSIAQADTPSSNNTIVLSTAYPSVITEKGNSITFSIDLVNQTPTWQSLDLKVEGPADWEPILKSSGMTVRSVMIEPGKSRSVDLQVKPPENATAQDYTFIVKATNANGVVVNDLPMTVRLQEKTSKGGLKFTTDYPNLRGQPGDSFSFRFDLANQSDQDRVVNFEATTPKDWTVTFKPGYESRQITSLPLKGNASQTITMDVSAPRRLDAGEYKLVVRAIADSDRVEVPLSIIVAGNPSLSLGTASGQLNARATVDAESKMTLIVKNTGSALLQNISLSASKPDGWDVNFNPDKIESLPVGQTTEVNVTLKPSNRALAGDYLVTMTASSGQASDSKDIRVTVETPTTWGFAALGAIGIVVVGLGLIFARFSRR